MTALSDEQVMTVDCPTCEVLAGIRCTSLNRTGYKPLKKLHPERVSRAEKSWLYGGPATITDTQILDLRAALFARKHGDALELNGLVACHEALGRSHRRAAARVLCADIISKLRAEATP